MIPGTGRQLFVKIAVLEVEIWQVFVLMVVNWSKVKLDRRGYNALGSGLEKSVSVIYWMKPFALEVEHHNAAVSKRVSEILPQ
jgi:hypothetical protein